ncbi:DNA primase [Ideonella livida]|uniref:DNA primase n=1 Tax=Ideonella livida TaxID=2707176 RepID=A0A7C9THH4_9BURK|nr:DNA primase [Ideonella livida]NDY90561.1 DNA primase [Ideonella livida]
MIPHSFIQDLLARTDIVNVVGRHVELKKAGINHKGLCPFHGEKSPSFIVSPSRQTYHCFGCGVHGDAIRFLSEHLGVSFTEAVEDLAQQAGLVVPREVQSPAQKAQEDAQRQQRTSLKDVLARAADHYRKQLRGAAGAVAYLKRRGLTGEIAQTFGLGYAPAGWRSLASAFPSYDDPLLVEAGLVIRAEDDQDNGRRYDRFRDRIMFPIRDVKGDVIGFGGRVLDQGEPKYLNSPETPLFVKGRELYGLFEARQAMREKGFVIVTEGYMDVVALAQWGQPNAVATLGTACTADHVHKLVKYTDRIVFSFDGDEAGRRAAGRALEAALPHATDVRSFSFLFLPAEHDPDSFIREHGHEKFAEQIEQAVPLSRQLLEHVGQGCRLSDVEGRARMLSRARPLWETLPEGALKRQLFLDLAQQGGLPAAELSQLWSSPAGPVRRSGGAVAPTEMGDVQASAAAPRGSRSGGGSGGGAQFARGADFSSRLAPRRGGRPAPASPQDRVVHMLLAHGQWWEQLTAEEQALLHDLPEPHGPVVAWLERQITEAGVQPLAAWQHSAAADEGIAEHWRALPMPDPAQEDTLQDLRRALDWLMERALQTQMAACLAEAASDPQALQRYRELDLRWRDVKSRLSTPVAG